MAAWPPALRIGSFDAMLNFDIADHPIYDGLELQWFDDVAHGTGMLALLTRRDSHVADYYRQRGLRLDVAATVRPRADGRARAGPADRRHRPHGGPVARCAVAPARLIKYAAPVVTIAVLADSEPAAEVDDPLHHEPRGALRDGVVEAATADGCTVRLEFEPPLPDLTTLADGAPPRGRWSVSAGGARLTGGRWFAERRTDGVGAGLDVTERWRPSKLPLLMRVVTAVVPVFRRWPTTYEWRARFGPDGRTTARWTRTSPTRADDYRRATGT